jgi:hypothetical protein
MSIYTVYCHAAVKTLHKPYRRFLYEKASVLKKKYIQVHEIRLKKGEKFSLILLVFGTCAEVDTGRKILHGLGNTVGFVGEEKPLSGLGHGGES